LRPLQFGAVSDSQCAVPPLPQMPRGRRARTRSSTAGAGSPTINPGRRPASSPRCSRPAPRAQSLATSARGSHGSTTYLHLEDREWQGHADPVFSRSPRSRSPGRHLRPAARLQHAPSRRDGGPHDRPLPRRDRDVHIAARRSATFHLPQPCSRVGCRTPPYCLNRSSCVVKTSRESNTTVVMLSSPLDLLFSPFSLYSLRISQPQTLAKPSAIRRCAGSRPRRKITSADSPNHSRFSGSAKPTSFVAPPPTVC
jgi:hypothetical protein